MPEGPGLPLVGPSPLNVNTSPIGGGHETTLESIHLKRRTGQRCLPSVENPSTLKLSNSLLDEAHFAILNNTMEATSSPTIKVPLNL